MAEQIGAMYVTIDGKDQISPLLKNLEKSLERVDKASGEIKIGNNRNFEYVRQQFADLSKYYSRLQDQMSTRTALKLETGDIEREMNTVMNAVKKLYSIINTPVNGTNFLDRPFESIKGNAKLGIDAVRGVKDEIDSYTKTVLGSARATAGLQQEIDRLGTKNGKAITANSAKEEANLVSKNRLIEGLTVAYNRLGYAMQDVGRKMLGAQGNDFLMSSGNGLLKRIEMYREAVGVALEGAKAGAYKRNDAVQLLGASYIDIYDSRGQFGKSVGLYQKDQKQAERMAESYAKEAERYNKAIADSVISRYDTESARRKQNSEEIAREALQYESLRKAVADAQSRTANVNRISSTPISPEQSMFSAQLRSQMEAGVKAQREAEISRERELKANQRNHEKMMRLQYKQNQDYNRLVANGKNELNRLYRLRAETHERMRDMTSRGVDTTELRNLMQNIQSAIREYKNVLNNISKSEAISILKGGSMRGNINTLANNAGALFRKDDRAKQIEEANLAQQRFLSDLNSASSKTSWLGEQFRMLKGYIVSAFAIDQLRSFLTNIVQIGGQLENQRIAIGSILGNKSQANDLFERIKLMAVKSPFGVLQLDQYTKSLTAYGYQYNELYDMLRRLADISAGAGVDMNRLTLAIGHVKAETALTGITLRQFTMANIPMLEMLSKMYSEVEKHSVTVADVRKRISGKQVSYDDVMAVLKNMTDEGGRFYDMQNVLSDSLKTKWKNLGDQMDIVYGEMAEGIPGNALKNLASVLMVIAKNWASIGKAAIAAGTAMASAKIVGFINGAFIGSKSSSITKKLAATDAEYKNNLRIARTYRELTVVEEEALATTNMLSNATLKLAATDGTLNKEMALRLLAQKKLNAEQVKYIASTLGIKDAEIAMAAGARAGSVSISMLGNAFRSIGVAIKGALLSFGPIAAMFAAFEGMFYIYDKIQKRSERAKQMSDEASEAYVKLQEVISRHTGDNTPVDDIGFTGAIEEYTEALKDYGAQTEDLKKRIFATKEVDGMTLSVKSLKEQYSELKDVLLEIDEINKTVAENGNIFSNADEETGYHTLGENLKDASDAFGNMSKNIAKADLKEWVSVLKDVKAKYSDFAKEVERQNIGNSIEKQIKLLYSSRFYNKIFQGGGGGFKLSSDQVNQFGQKQYRAAIEEMERDTEKFAENVKQQMKNAFGSVNWEKLSSQQKLFLDTQYKAWVSKYGEISQEVQKELMDVLSQKYHINISASIDWGKTTQDVAWKQKGADVVSGSPEASNVVKSAKEYAEMVGNAQKRYKELEEKLKQYNANFHKSAKDKSAISGPLDAVNMSIAAERDSVTKEMEALERLASKFGFNIREKIKDKSGNKRDQELIGWQKRIQAIERFLKLYKEYRDLYGEVAAKENIAKDIEGLNIEKLLGISVEDFGDPLKVRKAITAKMQQLYKSNGSDERQAARDTAVEKEKEESLNKEKEVIQLRMKAYEENARQEKERWDRFQEMRKAGLSDSVASVMTLKLDESLEDKYFKYVKTDAKAFKEGAGELVDINRLKAEQHDLEEELRNVRLKLVDGMSLDGTTVHRLESKVKELTKAIAEKAKEISDAELGIGGATTLDDAIAAGTARKKVLSIDWVEIMKQRLESAITASGKEYSVDELMKDLIDNPEKVKSIFGDKNGQNYKIYQLAEAYVSAQKEAEKRMDEAVKSTLSLLKGYDYVIKRIENEGKLNKENLGKTGEESSGVPGYSYNDLSDVNDELKKMRASADWMLLMDAPMTLVTKKAEVMAKAFKGTLAKALEAQIITTKEYSDEVAKIDSKLREARRKSDGEKGFADLKGRAEALNLGDRKGYLQNLKTLLEQEAVRLETKGDKKGAEEKRNEASKVQKNIDWIDDFDKILGGISNVFKALTDVISPVVDLFGALGMTDIADVFKTGSDALGAATQVAGGLKALGLEKAGPYGAAIGAGLSVMSSLLKQHDAALQKEIDASKARMQHDDWYLSTVSKMAQEQMGGLYSSNGNKEIMDKLNKQYNIDNKMLSMFAASKNLSGDTISAIEKATESGELYDAMMASAMAKRDEAMKQLAAEEEKNKSRDADAIREYEEQLYEATEEMEKLAKTVASELYSIDFKSWANDFGSALVSAWEQGLSGVKAYKDAVSDVLKNTVTSVIQQKYMQTKLEPIMEEFMKQFSADEGRLTEEGWGILEKMYGLGTEAAEATYAALNGIEQIAQRNGTTLRNDATGMSASIAGVTEDTADLLASYINGIRADVSVQRTVLTGIAADVALIAGRFAGEDQAMMAKGSSGSQGNVIDGSYIMVRLAEEQMPLVANTLASQLAELKRIEVNTARGAVATEALQDMISSAVNGTRPIAVSIQ